MLEEMIFFSCVENVPLYRHVHSLKISNLIKSYLVNRWSTKTFVMSICDYCHKYLLVGVKCKFCK